MLTRVYYSGSATMFPVHALLAYGLACLLIIVSPGPDNILAIGRGMSQGKLAALLSASGAALGVMCHTIAATLGLSLILQTSPIAFWVVKVVGGVYLIWLGYKAIKSRDMISFAPSALQSKRKIFATALLTNVLNPKVGLFVLAFLPQFVSAERGSVTGQLLVFGGIYAVLTVCVFGLMGVFAERLAGWVKRKPRVVAGINLGVGVVFLGAGVSVLGLRR